MLINIAGQGKSSLRGIDAKDVMALYFQCTYIRSSSLTALLASRFHEGSVAARACNPLIWLVRVTCP